MRAEGINTNLAFRTAHGAINLVDDDTVRPPVGKHGLHLYAQQRPSRRLWNTKEQLILQQMSDNAKWDTCCCSNFVAKHLSRAIVAVAETKQVVTRNLEAIDHRHNLALISTGL